jgi:hypothetical protein
VAVWRVLSPPGPHSGRGFTLARVWWPGTLRMQRPLMAHGDQQETIELESYVPECPLTWAFTSERVTGIEPALSAWESDRSESLTALTWELDTPLVTVMDPGSPGFNGPPMARGLMAPEAVCVLAVMARPVRLARSSGCCC